MNDDTPQTTADTDEALVLLGDLISIMHPWDRENLNCVARALAFLRKHDHVGLFLPVSVRDLMENANVAS